MGIKRDQIDNGAVGPRKLLAALRNGDYWYQRFPGDQPLLSCFTNGLGYGAPTGVTGDINLATFRYGQATYHIKGTQAILGPQDNGNGGSAIGGGLNIAGDVTAGDGFEFRFGSSGSGIQAPQPTTPFNFIVGRVARNPFIRIKLAVSNTVGTLAVGFRKDEVFQALIDSYDEMACLRVTTQAIDRSTILNNAATVNVSTGRTVTFNTYFELMLRLKGRLVRTFVNGVEVRPGSPFLFDVGEAIVPFCWYTGDGSAPIVLIRELELGYVEDVEDKK